jgi:aspartyl-tRNA(Asn)/glutamyl-tRNA(Gln) amidotransferase subunit C
VNEPASNPPDVERVLNTARLARLALVREEAQQLAGQFARILAAFQSLSELKLEGVEPMASPGGLSDVTRDDTPRPSLDRDLLLSAAPQREDGFLRVPRVVGGDS